MDVYNLVCELNTVICDDSIINKHSTVDNMIDTIKNYVIEHYPTKSEYIATYLLRYKSVEWSNIALLDASYIYKLLDKHYKLD